MYMRKCFLVDDVQTPPSLDFTLPSLILLFDETDGTPLIALFCKRLVQRYPS
jgi:hypothetical protein